MTNLNKTSSKVGAGVATGLMTIVGSCAVSALAAKILGKPPLAFARRALAPAAVVAIATGTAAAKTLPRLGALLHRPDQSAAVDETQEASSDLSSSVPSSTTAEKPSTEKGESTTESSSPSDPTSKKSGPPDETPTPSSSSHSATASRSPEESSGSTSWSESSPKPGELKPPEEPSPKAGKGKERAPPVETPKPEPAPPARPLSDIERYKKGEMSLRSLNKWDRMSVMQKTPALVAEKENPKEIIHTALTTKDAKERAALLKVLNAYSRPDLKKEGSACSTSSNHFLAAGELHKYAASEMADLWSGVGAPLLHEEAPFTLAWNGPAGAEGCRLAMMLSVLMSGDKLNAGDLYKGCEKLLRSPKFRPDDITAICRDLFDPDPAPGNPWPGSHAESVLPLLREYIDDETLFEMSKSYHPLALLRGFGYGEDDEASAICSAILDQPHTAERLLTILSDFDFSYSAPADRLRKMCERLKGRLPETEKELTSLFEYSGLVGDRVKALVLSPAQLRLLCRDRKSGHRWESESSDSWMTELADWLENRDSAPPSSWPARLRCCLEDQTIRSAALKAAFEQADCVRSHEYSSFSSASYTYKSKEKREIDYLREIVAFTVSEEDAELIGAEIKRHSSGVKSYWSEAHQNEFPEHVQGLLNRLWTAIPEETYLQLVAKLETSLVKAVSFDSLHSPSPPNAILLKAIATSWTESGRIDDLLAVLTHHSYGSYRENGMLFKVRPEDALTDVVPTWADYLTGIRAERPKLESLDNFCKVVRQMPPAAIRAIPMTAWPLLLEQYSQVDPKTPPYELLCTLPWVASKQETPDAARQAGALFSAALERFGCSDDSPAISSLRVPTEKRPPVAWHVGYALGVSEQAEHFIAGIRAAPTEDAAPMEIVGHSLTVDSEISRKSYSLGLHSYVRISDVSTLAAVLSSK